MFNEWSILIIFFLYNHLENISIHNKEIVMSKSPIIEECFEGP